MKRGDPPAGMDVETGGSVLFQSPRANISLSEAGAQDYFTRVKAITGITRVVLLRYSAKPGLTATILS